MNFIFCLVVAAFAFAITSTHAQNYVVLPQKRQSSCALVNQKIYCYGGNRIDGTQEVVDTSLSTLNIVNITESWATKWEIITDAKNSDLVTISPRTQPQFAATGDGKNLFLSGGMPKAYNRTSPQHLLYNPDANAWTSLPDFDDGVNGNFRQISLAGMTYVPDQEKFFFYGGIEFYHPQNWYLDTLTNTNITNITFLNEPSKSKVGYYRMTTLDINNGGIWKIIPQQNAANVDYNTQSAIYHNTTRKIYYFGGIYNQFGIIGSTNLTFNKALVFDTETSSWGTQNFTGAADGFIPTPRRYHTMTLLPTGHHVLLYGGTPDAEVSSAGFCFIADLVNFKWTSCNNIKLPSGGVPNRAQHSAVLDPIKQVVYILFGFSDSSTSPNTFDTVLVLNVSDPSAVAFVETTKLTETPPNVTSPNEGQTSSSGSNGGTIGGAVGGAIGGLLVVGLIAFLIYKKKKKSSKESIDQQEEHMSVDWDAIDGEYTETYPVSDIRAKNVEKPSYYETHSQGKDEATTQFSPVLTNTNLTDTTAISSPNTPDHSFQQNHTTLRVNNLVKPDFA